MTLHDFSIHSPSTVILADNRDASQSWARHLRDAGPGRGGVDVVAPVGTPVYAWADGTVTRQPNNGTAGNVARLHLEHDPGWILDYKHLSSYVDLVNGVARKGQLIGYSGQSGAPGQPHVHYNLVDPQGNRQNPWLYVSGAAQSGTVTPTTQGVQEMRLIQQTNRGIAVVGAGYYKSLTPEELPLALAVWGAPVVFATEREFDLARSVSVNGVQALVSVKK